MKSLILILLIFTAQISLGETLLDNTPPLGPLKSPSSLIKLKVLDSFNGKTKLHGLIVEMIAENFWVDEPTSTLKYSVKVSHEDVMKEYSTYEIILMSLQADLPQQASQDVLAIADFLLALERAGKEGVKVVNYSVASYYDSPNAYEYKQIVKILKKYDMLLVVPSGNEGRVANRYPCSYNHPQIICVAAGERSYILQGKNSDGIILDKYSNDNDQVKFVASGKFDKIQGTSFAAPRVAQALAFLWSYYPQAKSTDIVNKLKSHGRFVEPKTLATDFSQSLDYLLLMNK